MIRQTDKGRKDIKTIKKRQTDKERVRRQLKIRQRDKGRKDKANKERKD